MPVGAIAVDAFAAAARHSRACSRRRLLASAGAGSAALTLVRDRVLDGGGRRGGAASVAAAGAAAHSASRSSIALPLTFSGLIVAYGFILGYGRAGFVTQLLAGVGLDAATIGGALFTPIGLAFASSYYLIPRVVIGVLPVLVNFDQAQLAAAESLGATPRAGVPPRPAAAGRGPGVASFCLIAAVVFGAYGTALALVGTQLPILPLRLYSLISDTGLRFSGGRRTGAVDHRGLLDRPSFGEWIGSRHERHL